MEIQSVGIDLFIKNLLKFIFNEIRFHKYKNNEKIIIKLGTEGAKNRDLQSDRNCITLF